MTIPFDAIIFDMDGLLVDSESVWHIAETELIEAHGHTYTEEVRESIVGLRMDIFMAKLKDIYNFEESVPTLSKNLTKRMLQLIPEKVTAKAGAQELIDFVCEYDIPRAIASSSSMAVINATLESQGWDQAFKLRCTAEDDVHGKPAPDVYLRAAKLVGVSPSGCLALEDSPNGARAAIAAGMTCYAVPDATHTRPAAFKGVTEHVFKDLHAVLNHLKAT